MRGQMTKDSATRHPTAEPIGSKTPFPDSANGGTMIPVAAGATPEDRFLGLVEKIALSPDADVAKLSQLREIRSQWRADEAREAFAADFVLMKPHLPRVIKTHDNTQTNSRYAKLEDINAIIDPILAQFGFGTSTEIVKQTESEITVRAKLWHRGGHIETTELSMPPDDSG